MHIVYNIMDGKQILTVFLVSIVAFSIIAGSMSATVSAGQYEFDEPTVSAYINGDNTMESGETKVFDVRVGNRGDTIVQNDNNIADLQSASSVYEVKPGKIQGVRIRFEDKDTPFDEDDEGKFDVKADTVSLNKISTGISAGQRVEIESSEDLESGTYEIPVEVQYTYVYRIYTGEDDHIIHKNTENEDMNIEIKVEESGSLDISSSDNTGLYENSEGQINLQVKNTGDENAEDVTIEMVDSQNIKSSTNMVNLGTLEAGEESESGFQVSVSDINSEGDYSVGFKMRYEGNNGKTKYTDTEYASVSVTEGPSYDIETKESELYVNSLGRVEVEVKNTGDSDIEEARVNLQPEEPFSPVSSSSWIGNLETEESTTAVFKLDVSDRAVAQSYPLDFVVEYDDNNDNRIQSEILTAEAKVGEEKSFDVLDSSEISAGTTETIAYEIQNTGDSELKDATVRINSNSPFETDDDTSYVGTLEPGDKDTVRYKISVESSATVNKTYSLDTTTKFKNEYGDTVTTDTVSAPVKVVPDDSLPLIPIIGGAGAVIGLIVAVVLYKVR